MAKTRARKFATHIVGLQTSTIGIICSYLQPALAALGRVLAIRECLSTLWKGSTVSMDDCGFLAAPSSERKRPFDVFDSSDP
jgi:hypothetical protein